MAEVARKMNIYEAISRCMEEIGAVGKDAENEQQHFKYREAPSCFLFMQQGYIRIQSGRNLHFWQEKTCWNKEERNGQRRAAVH